MSLSNSQKAQEYYENCKRFIKGKLAEGSLSFSAEGKVVRSDVYQAIKASRSVMNQNPRVKRLLGATERWARMRGFVPASKLNGSDDYRYLSGNNDPQVAQLKARISQLERRVAALTVENQELRKVVKRSEWIDQLLIDPEGRLGVLPW